MRCNDQYSRVSLPTASRIEDSVPMQSALFGPCKQCVYEHDAQNRFQKKATVLDMRIGIQMDRIRNLCRIRRSSMTSP